jgi:replicative DNA helicase
MGLEKIPPQNLEAEQSVLGSMLLDKNAVIDVAEFLTSEHFYDSKHGDIYQAIMDLFEEGSPIDLVTVSDRLKTRKLLRKVGGRTYLTDLVSMVPTAAHAEEYATIVKDTALRRALISAASDITNISYDETVEVKDVVDKSEQMLFGIAQSGVRSKFKHIKDLLKNAFDRAELASKGETALGISSGLRDLDALLGGFQKSDMIILAARPSVGKTSLALDFMKYAAVHEKKKVMFFSLEMSNEQIIDRLLGMQANVPFWEIRTGNMNDEKYARYGEAMGVLSECDVFIDDTPGQNITEIRTKARRLAIERGIDIIFVDYLQLLSGHSKDNRVQEVAEISKGLKNIARELQVPVVALSQLSRAIEQRGGARMPQLSDLRESGSIEQDADVVMFIDREDSYNPDTERKGLADLFIAKHRNGPTGKIELAFIKEIASFRNLYKGGGK